MQSVFDREKISPDQIGILLLSHGPLACAAIESVGQIFGEVENIAAFSLDSSDNIDTYSEKFMEAYHAFPAGCLVLVDLFSGTPCNRLALAVRDSAGPVYALTGLNLSMLIDAISFRMTGMRGKALLEAVEKSAHEGIVNLSEKMGLAI